MLGCSRFVQFFKARFARRHNAWVHALCQAHFHQAWFCQACFVRLAFDRHALSGLLLSGMLGCASFVHLVLSPSTETPA